MIYLNIDDLKTDSFERFIRESSNDFEKAIDKAELRAIGKVKPYLRDNYDVNAIFDSQMPIRDEALVDILVTLTLSKLHGRNSARKFADKDDIERVMKELDKIASGKITLELPLPISENGVNDLDDLMFGNTSNENFYL